MGASTKQVRRFPTPEKSTQNFALYGRRRPRETAVSTAPPRYLPTRKWSPHAAWPSRGFSKATSASLGRPTQLQSRPSAAMDRQVSERPVDRHHRPDRPLGQVGEGHRGKRVDLAVEGQLTQPETTTTSTSTSSLRCGSIRSPRPSQTKLACRSSPSSHHRAPGRFPAAARLARSTGETASPIPPCSHPTPSVRRTNCHLEIAA